MREPVSAFIVCFNEEDQIRDCIESLRFCDEIVVIDSFSTDRTVEIAREMGATVIQRAWTGYIDQKSFGLAQVKHEWVVNLDADERVSPELRENILALLEQERAAVDKGQNAGRPVGYYISRVVFYLGRWWRRGGWYPEYRLRVFQKSHVRWGGVEPHEKPIIEGRTGRLVGEIQHFTYENMDDQLRRMHQFSTIAAKEEFKSGRRASVASIVFNPVMRTFKFYFLKKGYREGTAGLIVALIEGYYAFMKYAKLWELQYNESQDDAENEQRRPAAHQ